MRRIILASASPRRKKLLEKAGLKFEIAESGIEEKINKKLPADELTRELSMRKAKDVAPKVKNALIIAADSVVVINGKILGKPKDEEDAVRILESLNGKMHYSVTSFTILDTKTKRSVTKSVRTEIYFNRVSKQNIVDYVSSKKPLDKAGAYGIQELPKEFVRRIVGDFDNVVGLPTSAVLKELKRFDI